MRTRTFSFVASTVAVVLLVGACSSGDHASKKRKTTTTVETTTTVAPTTTAKPPTVAPLTGLPVSGDQAARVNRPALAIKIDNSPDALPQTGVNNTDMVFEIQVEGISRLMAVFHSNDAGRVGPTRSARYSDPPILAMLGKPLFGWSGANKGVIRAVEAAKYINNVNWNAYPKDYARSRDRKAPHNLYTSTPTLFGHVKPGEGTPPAQFDFLQSGQGNATATPAAGVNVEVGTTPSTWVWDGGHNRYVRWEYGRRHQTTDAGQVWAQSVVILATQYTKGPTAVTVGAGKALVLTGGQAIAGVWSRAEQPNRYTLKAVDGSPIRLNPGRVWVELPNHPWGIIPSNVAAGLLGGR